MTSQNPPLNILVPGIYWSGSGAVVDYLKGHPDCFTPRGEFTDFKSHGRIASMLTATSSAEASRIAARMWFHTLFQRIPVAAFKQLRGKSPKSLPLKEQLTHNRLKLHWLGRYRARLAVGGAPADTAVWNAWIQAMGQRYAPARQAIVWNQPIWIGQHEDVWPQVFSPCKTLVVHREPTDQFAEVVRQGKIGKRKSDPAFPQAEKDPIAYVLKGIASKQQSLLALQEKLGGDELMIVSFERFVLEHDQQAQRICQFLGLPTAQHPDAPFRPEESARNIGIGQTEEIAAMLQPYGAELARLQSLHEELMQLS